MSHLVQGLSHVEATRRGPKEHKAHLKKKKKDSAWTPANPRGTLNTCQAESASTTPALIILPLFPQACGILGEPTTTPVPKPELRQGQSSATVAHTNTPPLLEREKGAPPRPPQETLLPPV